MAHGDHQVMVVGGGGQMGNGIAQVAATAGFEVTLDLDAAALDRGVGRIERSLGRLVKFNHPMGPLATV